MMPHNRQPQSRGARRPFGLALLSCVAVAHCVPAGTLYEGDAGVGSTTSADRQSTMGERTPDAGSAGRGSTAGHHDSGRDANPPILVTEDGGDESPSSPEATPEDSPEDSGAHDPEPRDASEEPEPAGLDSDASVAEDSGAEPLEPDTINWNGTWGGLTSMGTFIRFSLFDGAALSVAFDWMVPTAGCTGFGGVITTFQAPIIVENGESFSVGPLPTPDLSYTLSGRFGPDGVASGELDLSYPVPGCSGSSRVSWSATPVVCGNGRVEWPETCDDGTRERSDGCSELCQVPALAEVEPNDIPAQAGEPHEADIILTGSLEGGGDVDLFAITNPHAGPIAVSFETHGQTIGVCLVDTFLEIVDASGTVLAEDDDGARAWFCSALSYSMDAAETVYVRVTSFDQRPIPAYAVAVNFQDG